MSFEQFKQLRNGGNTVNDIVEAETGLPTPTLNNPKPPSFDVAETLKNIPSSAGNFFGQLVGAVAHPIQTIQGLGGLAAGGIEKFIPGKQGQEKYVDALIQYANDRYGGTDKFLSTLQQDPVGVAADLSVLLTGGGAILGKLGTVGKLGEFANITNKAERLATITKAIGAGELGKTAQIGSQISHAGNILNPLNTFGGAIEGVKNLTMNNPIGRIVGAGVKGVGGVLPNLSEQTLNTIKQYPKEVEALSTAKSLPINPIMDKLSEAGKTLRGEVANYQNELKNISRANPLGGVGQDASRILIQQELGNLRGKAIEVLRDNNIGVKQTGELNFDRPIKPSSIINTGERKNIQETYRLLGTLDNSVSVDHVEAVLERMSKLRKYESPSLQGTKASIVIEKMYRTLNEGMKNIDQFKDLYKLRKKYANTFKAVDQIDNLLPRDSAGNISRAAINRVKGLSRQEVSNLEKPTLDYIKQKTGIDLEKELSIYSAAKEINPHLIPQDLSVYIRKTGISAAMQKAANPALGQYHIERAKASQNRFFQLIGKANEKTSGKKTTILNLLRYGNLNQ